MIIVACQIALYIIAAIVSVGLIRKRNMWLWIISYWLVLTLKNFLEILGV